MAGYSFIIWQADWKEITRVTVEQIAEQASNVNKAHEENLLEMKRD